MKKLKHVYKRILHIGAGKINLNDTPDFHVHLDRGYKGLVHDLKFVEEAYAEGQSGHYFVSSDIFEFMDSFKFKFDIIEAYRIFEHMDYCSGEIGRLLEASNMITLKNATLDIIVPNAKKLSQMILDYETVDWEDKGDDYSLRNNIKLIINTEFCNIKHVDPHGSVWTPRFAEEYIVQEGTWKVNSIKNIEEYMGRNIYMQILCSKV